MKKLGHLLLFSALGLTTAIVTAEEPPDDTIVQQILEESGFTEAPDDAASVLDAKWLIEEERLSRSGARVVKFTEKFPYIDATVPPVERYVEIVKINVRGEPRLYTRPLPAAEATRREFEANGVSPELMAQGLRNYAAGMLATGEVLRAELAKTPYGSVMNALGFSSFSLAGFKDSGTLDGRPILPSVDCEEMLAMAAAVESKKASDATGVDDLEIPSYLSLNPLTFMLGPACMMLVTADAFEAIDELDEETKQQMMDALEQALDEIEFVGTEQVNGRKSYGLRMDDVDLVEPLAADATQGHERRNGLATPGLSHTGKRYTADFADGRLVIRPASSVGNFDERIPYEAYQRQPAIFYYDTDARSAHQPFVRQVQTGGRGSAAAGTVAINSIELWIDAEYFVERKMRMEGVMTENGRSQEVFMERELQDYRNVPDSALYEPYKTVMRAGGMLTEAQRAELAESQKQLEEFEREMASMPADQRAMMEQMMGDRLEQMRNMVSGGTFEIETITTSIEINPDFRNPRLEQFAREAMGAPANVKRGEDNLVQIIQFDLSTLGYEPGNIDGVLDTMTQVAISQFQAESELQVTGQPSAELARALEAAVAGQ